MNYHLYAGISLTSMKCCRLENFSPVFENVVCDVLAMAGNNLYVKKGNTLLRLDTFSNPHGAQPTSCTFDTAVKSKIPSELYSYPKSISFTVAL
jgi:hypothetical protein